MDKKTNNPDIIALKFLRQISIVQRIINEIGDFLKLNRTVRSIYKEFNFYHSEFNFYIQTDRKVEPDFTWSITASWMDEYWEIDARVMYTTEYGETTFQSYERETSDFDLFLQYLVEVTTELKSHAFSFDFKIPQCQE